MLTDWKKKYIGSADFYRYYIRLALPMILQNFVTNFVSFLDNIMVGQLGTEQMTGVAIINQLNFIYSLAVFGVAGAAAIFGAQYYGKGDSRGHMYTFRFRLYVITAVTVAAIAIFRLFGGDLVDLYTTAEAGSGSARLTKEYALTYLEIILIGLLPFGVTQAYASVVKETGQTFVPMVAGMAGVAANGILDYLLIFGVGPLPALGVAGAAVATVISRVIECAIVVIWAHGRRGKDRFPAGAYQGFGLPVELFGRIMKKGTPLILNELLWSMGMTALTQSYAIRDLGVVAAQNISSTINNLFNIVFIQLGACISIVVGSRLGAGKLEEAKDADNKMIFFDFVCCTAMAAIMLLAGHLFPEIYNTSDEIKALATDFIRIQALVMPFCALSHCFYFTLRTGGKTFVTFLFDSGFTWVIMVAAARGLCTMTDLPVVTIFFLVHFTELIKNVLGYAMVKSNVWLVQMV